MSTFGVGNMKILRPGVPTEKGHQPAKVAPTKKLDIDALRARRAARLSGQTPDGVVALSPEELGQYAREYLKLVSEENELQAQLAALDQREAGKVVNMVDLNHEVQNLEATLAAVCKDRSELGSFAGVMDESLRLGKLFASAETVAETATGLMPGRTRRSDINHLVNYAVSNGVATSKDGVITPITNDEVVVNAVKELTGFLSKNEEQRDANRCAEEHIFANHLMEEKKMLDMRKTEGAARSLTEFFNGNGFFFVLPLPGQDKSGKEKFFGFTLLERADGKITYERASWLEGAKRLFSFFNHQTEERVIKKGPQVLTIKDGNVSKEGNNLLREAIQKQQEKEIQAAKVREAATKLREVEGRISFRDLRYGKTGTWVVDIRDWKLLARSLTFHVEALDGGFRVTNTVPGVFENEPRLKGYTGQSSLTKLDEPFWRFILAHNGRMEQSVVASQKGAVPVTKENIGGLLELKGKDGLYSFFTTWFQKERQGGKDVRTKDIRTDVYYIMERSGDQLKVVWTAAGLSAKLISREHEAAESFPVTDLPKMVKTVLRQVYTGVSNLRGAETVKANTPRHLWPEVWLSESETLSEETSTSGETPTQTKDEVKPAAKPSQG